MDQHSNIAIRFHNGVRVVDGTIIHQKTSKRFTVTDGTVEQDVLLARTKTEVESLEPGMATIIFHPLVDGEPFEDEHIYMMTEGYVFTVEGGRFRRNDPFHGSIKTKDIE